MKVLVIGSGKSGVAAAKLAKRMGNNVFLTELNPKAETSELCDMLKQHQIEYEFGKNSIDNLNQYELCISSPGVPPSALIIKELEKVGVPIISEIEYAYRNLSADVKIIGVTGTNGKTTTVTLLAHILEHAGRSVKLVGNVGKPMADVADSVQSGDVLVVELSSYQLDRIDTFKADVAIIMNITEDHLSYHGSYQQYAKAKWKITSNQIAENLLVLNCDDEILKLIIENGSFVSGGEKFETKAQIGFISLHSDRISTMGVSCEGENIVYRTQQHKEEIMPTNNVPLYGEHNLYNTFATVIAAKYLQIRNEDIRDAVASFKGVEHRLEVVRDLRGVRFVNDSKATNVNSTWYALKSFDNDIVWLAGGLLSGNDYTILEELVQEKVKYLICFGEEKNRLFDKFSDKVKCFLSNNLTEAVQEAAVVAKQGDVVLLSPACKSFDEFVNFEHRGEVFKQVVNSLA
jgi:UDP-N-acetylmuramoylalanine--D-glutamate ligase